MRTFTSLFIVFILCGILSAHPNHPADSLSLAANKAYSEGNWSDCAHFYTEAVEHGVNDAGTVYNCACCYALSGNINSAFAWLDSAIARDFTNVQHLKRDTDFAALHSDPRWPKAVEKMQAAEHAYLQREGIHAELFYMRKADQLERILPPDSISPDTMALHDALRLKRVRELVAANELRVSHDYFNAALIAQHGRDSTDYLLAHTLAKKSVELDSTDGTAKWLACAAQDRYLQSTGQPQIWGTQFVRGPDGKWTLEPLDSTAVSDAQRGCWNVPSLSEARKRCDKMNSENK